MSIINVRSDELADAYLCIIESMRKYQEINNIRGQCFYNALYLWNNIRHLKDCNITLQAVIFLGNDYTTKQTILVPNHVVVMVGDVVLDPSWETYKCQERHYFKEFEFAIKFLNKKDRKALICQKGIFIKAQKNINSFLDRNIIIKKSDYFHKQAEYVENSLKLKFHRET